MLPYPIIRKAHLYNRLMLTAWKHKLRHPSLLGFKQQVFGLLGFTLLYVAVAVAGKEFAMPAAKPAQNYAARDAHPTEKITIAVDPYDTEEKASIFTIKFRNNGLLPILFVVTNDGDEPVSLVSMKAQLNTKDRSKLLPSSTDDLQRRLSRPKRNDRQNTLPIPLPKKEVKGGVDRKMLDEIEQAQFSAKAVEPHSTARGFLFFDVSDIADPLPGASFYLVGVQDGRGNDVMYFEIPMEKYLNAGGSK
jgi:hypothetical protein